MKIAAKWGAILGVSVCVWTLVIHFLGFYTTNLAAGQTADIAATILPIAAIVLALREQRRALARGLLIKESVAVGVVAGLVSVPITAGFLWWYHHFLNPQWLDLLVEYQRAKLTAAGVSADVIETSLTAQRASGSDMAQLFGALIGTTVFSLLISLIAGAFMRRAPAAVAVLLLALSASPATAQRAQQAQRPNIVLIFPDNLGWGEVGAYGSVRGVPTPNIDSLAAQGIRLDNFNVEFSCTVSRAALLTGRYAIRSGATQPTGITQWEITIAEALKPAGYATALFGKWHLGGSNWIDGRTPINQGFDEWFGIPNTSNEAQFTTTPGYDSTRTPVPYIWEQKAGEPAKKAQVFDLASRRTLDREAALRSVAFMERNARAGKPFFLFFPITQIHFPTLPHPDFAGKTGAGDIGDAMADVDFNVGIITGALKRLGLDRNTLVFWCTDNGPEGRRPWRGSSGPWRGFYNSVMEGGIRTPCIVRWVGRIPRGQSSNEIVHELDIFPTIAAAAGVDMPRDRPIDGVNQLPFLERKQAHSNRESALYFTGTQVRAVKWKEWKFHYAFQPEPRVTEPPLMRLFNLRSDPKEESDIKDTNPWAIGVFDKLVAEYAASAAQFPNVPVGARDPYEPRRP